MTPPRKRAARTRAPEGKRPKAPDERPSAKVDDATPPAGAAGATGRGSLAPDPATVVFGSSRPIATTPPKLPEGSGLRFSGPSAGILKASGPQPTSPKASGLTFTSAKASTAAKPASGAAAKPGPAIKPPQAKKADSSKPEPGKPGGDGIEIKKPPLTKPAIAPQATGPRFGKERSTGSFVGLMLVLTLVGGGLAFWIKLESETPPAPAAPKVAASEGAAVTGNALPEAEPLAATDSAPVETIPESLAAAGAGSDPALDPAPDVELSAAEIGEIQQLLSFFDLSPGRADGMLTAATTEAIRNYQEMAGLPADGEANRALLEELRSVAALYGS